MPTAKYSNYLEINPSFESVVDIDADTRNTNLWREYIVGDDMESLVEQMCQSIGNEAPDLRRSFWIHGSYGTGKSYAAIFVKHLMEEKPEVVGDFLAASSRLAKYKNRVMKFRSKGDFLVVWKTGCSGIRSGDMMLLEMEQAIQQALVAKFGDKAQLGSSSLLDAVKAKLDDPGTNWDYLIETTSLGDDYSSADELRAQVNEGNLKAIQAAAAVIRRRGGLINNLDTFKAWIADVIESKGLSKSGIFFIWDEFTEYVAHSDDHTVMQQISEFCKVQPLFMLYVVHRSQEMVDSMGKDRYQMITNRFHQTEFHVSADAAFDLIAGSINVRNGMSETWKEDRKAVINRIQPSLPDMSGLDDKISEHIQLFCPMHPMTIRLLSRVAESFAAAQRTMFRFMKDGSSTELGFLGYISKYGPDDQFCWLTPDWLWDYFFTRTSDFSDKDTKAAEYIHHYEESKHLVENDEHAHCVFKTAMLLLAVMSSTKGVYGGMKAHGGISATQGCLINCLAGVMSADKVKDLLTTLEDCKILLRDEATNGVIRLQLPFRGGNGDDFKIRYEANDTKFSRYQMFAKDGKFSSIFERMAWDENDAAFKRMKICVCCAETLSIKTRLEEIKKELDKCPYKLGLLIVTVRDDAQYMSIQKDLENHAALSGEPRLIIALVKTPFTDEKRKQWLTSITKQELASAGAQTAAASQHENDARIIVNTWVNEAVSVSNIIAWNEKNVFTNQFGMLNLRKTIRMNVQDVLFPYAPETIVVTSTAYKPCNDPAPLAGITRAATNSQLKNVLDGLKLPGLLSLNTINSMVDANGSKQATSVSALAKLIRDEMESGQKVVLSDLWVKLQAAPFGYYNCIACGVLLGYVFSCYKDSAFSWTDNVQSTHVLGDATLKTLILNMVKGIMTTDYLSAGSVTFQQFRQYAKYILNLSDAEIANETACWHNMREAVTKTGSPFWALKYLPDAVYGSPDFKQVAMKIIDNMQEFIAAENNSEGAMSNVIQLFNGRGKLRVNLTKAFQDKNVMAVAFRTFLFDASPELKAIADKLSVTPEALSDKLHMVMQNAIYTWTEEQVKGKLPDIVSEYGYLDALNSALEKVYHSTEDAVKDLANLFKFLRISMAAIAKLDKPWFAAMQILYKVSHNGISHMTQEERTADIAVLTQYGKNAMDCLKDAKPVLADILESEDIDCTQQELDSIYAGLKDMTCDTSLSQFEKELKTQIGRISQVRNRALLQERWLSLTGKESVKAWCSDHSAPLLWIIPKEFKKDFVTLIDVQKNNRVLDQSVQNAINTLSTMDAAILNDSAKINDAFMKIIGIEYASLFQECGPVILAQAKMRIGNDMSAWDTSDLPTLLGLLKNAQKEKAKKEKLAGAKKKAAVMPESDLRSRVVQFLDEHPEFCDFFAK